MLKKSVVIYGFAVGMAATFGWGCEEDTDDLTISQFDRPQDVAFVCYDDNENIPLPIGCCKTELSLDDLSCASHAASAKLYAFVTQTTSGEVAVVDVEEQEIVDQESRIPYNTFIPVGGQPNDIAATDDGTRVYTANYETGDISVIRVVDKEKELSVIKDPFLSPAASIDLGGPAAKMILVKSPENYKDRFALVTQPSLGRLTVVALDAADCPDPEANPDGCALGYVLLTANSLTASSDSDIAADDATPHLSAITASTGQSAFVGSYDTQVLWDVQIESLVTESLLLEAFGAVDVEKVLNDTISIAPYTARALSLEPVRKRWIYAIENAAGGVIAVNLQDRVQGSGEQAEVISVSVPGRARSLSLVELEEEGDPDPLTFNGTFAVVATTQAGFGVVDVEDNNPTTIYTRSHTLRSVVNLNDADGGIPAIEEDPTLIVDEEKIDESSVDQYVAFDTEEVDGGCDAGDEFKATYDHGIRFRCNPYQSRRETWYLDWEGSIGISGVGVIANIVDPKDGVWHLLSEDENKDFCAQELYTEGSVPDYPGDRLIITSEPTPDEGSEKKCDKFYDPDKELSYRITGVSRYDEQAQVEFKKENSESLDLLPECYGQAVSYEIRASGQWIVKGSRSSYKTTAGVFDEDAGICDPAVPSKMRMKGGEPFENDYLKFRMVYQKKWPKGPVPIDPEENETDMEVTAKYEFTVEGGYEEMYRNISGSNITDIEFTPDNEVVFVDQGGEGLIIFDMLNTFGIIGGNIN